MNKNLCLCLCLLFCPFISHAQWTEMTNVPNTGYTAHGVTHVGNYRYLFTDHGVYTLNDKFIATREIFPNQVKTFLTREDTLILFADYVYFLIHDGDSIRTEKSRYTIGKSEISIDADSVIIFSGGVIAFRTLDGRFDQYVDGIPNLGDGFGVRGFALSNDTLYAAQSKTMYYCKLGEYKWSQLPLDLPLDIRGKGIGLFRIRGQEIIVAINHSITSPDFSKHDCMLYYSNDWGQNFVPWSPEYPKSTTGFVEHDSTYFWAVNGSGILKKGFTDTIWQPFNIGLESLAVNFISKVDDKMYCGTTGQQGYWLDDSVWQPITLEVPQFYVQNMISGDGNLYVTTRDSIYLVRDGQSWENITPPDAPEKTWRHLIKRSDRLIVSGFDDGYMLNNWEIFFLPDGEEWSRRQTPFNNELYGYNYDKWLINDDHRLHIHMGQGWYSDTQAWTWKYSFSQMASLDYMAIAGHMVYVVQNGGLGRFSQSPSKWEYLPNLVLTLENMGYEVNNSNQAIDLFFSCQDRLFFHYKDHSPDRQHGFFRSDDLGETWHQVNDGLEDALQSSFDIRSHSTNGSAIAIVTSIGCLFSKNLGDSWVVIKGVMGNSRLAAILNDTLYYSNYTSHGHKAGIWKYPLNNIGLSNNNIQAQTIKFSLYPNPAGQYFKIKASYPYKALNVSLFSIAGKLIMKKPVVPGERINLHDYPEGIYVVKISDGQNHQLEKLVISNITY